MIFNYCIVIKSSNNNIVEMQSQVISCEDVMKQIKFHYNQLTFSDNAVIMEAFNTTSLFHNESTLTTLANAKSFITTTQKLIKNNPELRIKEIEDELFNLSSVLIRIKKAAQNLINIIDN